MTDEERLAVHRIVWPEYARNDGLRPSSADEWRDDARALADYAVGLRRELEMERARAEEWHAQYEAEARLVDDLRRRVRELELGCIDTGFDVEVRRKFPDCFTEDTDDRE